MTNRLEEFDFIRAIAALSVIAIHITASVATKNPIAYYWNQSIRYAVPIFILLSGFLLFYSDNKKEQLSFKVFIEKRMKKIVIPYIIWHTFFTFYKLIKNNQSLSTVLDYSFFKAYIINFFTGGGYVHLYFLPIMIQLYFLYPMLYKYMKKTPKVILLLSFLLTVLSQTLFYFHQLNWISLPPTKVPYAIMFPVWIFYFVFGMYIALNYSTLQKFSSSHKLMIVILWTLSLLILFWDSKLTNTYSSSIKPTVMIFTCTSYFLFQVVFSVIKNRYHQFSFIFKWISVNSYVIFFSHFLIIDFINKILIRNSLMKIMNHIEGILFVFILTSIFTALLVYVISYIPGYALIGGGPNKNQLLKANKPLELIKKSL